MAEKIKSALPPDLDLGGGWVVEWDAVDPTTGATVAGVIISKTSLLVPGDYGGGGGIEAATPYLLVPGPGDSSGLQFGGQVGGTVPPPPSPGVVPPPPPSGEPPPPPPTEPPPTLGSVWAWDARKATVKPNSASLVQNFLTYCGPIGYFFIEVAHAVVTTHDLSAVYKVDTAGKVGAMDSVLYVPNGTRGGLSDDQHLWIEDKVSKRWHDLDGCSFTNGKLTNWRFGSSMPAGSVQVPDVVGKTHQGATAAGFPLARGSVTPSEAAAGTIPHPLVFTAANLGPAPCPYPSPPGTPGYKTGNVPSGSSIAGHIPLGTWMRLSPSAQLPAAATHAERMVFACLQQYGMFCRDRGSVVTLHGQDPGGGGGSIPAWRNAGVPLADNGVLHLHNIPWGQLQVLEAPPH